MRGQEVREEEKGSSTEAMMSPSSSSGPELIMELRRARAGCLFEGYLKWIESHVPPELHIIWKPADKIQFAENA